MTRLAWVLTGVALLALTTGCGGDDRPVDAVPALSAQLDRVDAAVSSGHPGAARSALDDLASETAQARDDGTLDEDDADAILEAISTLEGQLPEPAGQPSDTASETPPPSPSAEPDEDEADEKETQAPPPDKPKPHPKPDKEPKPPKEHGHDKPGHGKPGHGHGH